MNKLLTFPFLIFLFLSIFSASVYAETLILNGTANLGDTTVYNSTNFNSTFSNTGNTTVISLYGVNRWGFIKFNLSSIPSGVTITSANLSLRRTSTIASTQYVSVYNTSLYNSTGAGPWVEGTIDFYQINCGTKCLITENITWTTQPAVGTLQSKIDIYSVVGRRGGLWDDWNVTEAVKTAYSKTGVNQTVSLLINSSISSSSFYSKETNVTLEPQLDIEYTPTAESCGACPLSDDGLNCERPAFNGSWCDATLGNDIIRTTSFDCVTDIYTECPLGTQCGQITPQVNITTAIIQDFTDCAECKYVYFWPLTEFAPILLYTNCESNPECNPGITNATGIYSSGCFFDSVQDGLAGAITCPGVYITPTDIEPASASYYTAGCYNSLSKSYPLVLDEYGNITDINNLTKAIFGNDTNLTSPRLSRCPNTTTSCYVLVNNSCVSALCVPGTSADAKDAVLASVAGKFALFVGSAFGITDATTSLLLFSALISLIIGLFILYILRDSEQAGITFIITIMIGLVTFTLIGWFPGWIMIILIVLSALGIAKTLGIGG